MKVKDLMTRDVATVPPEALLKDVAVILVARGISGLPVTDVSGDVLGVVSEADFLVKERGEIPRGGRLRSWLTGESGETREKLTARTAGEAMTSPAVTIEASRTVAQAAALMIERGVNRLPVLDGRRLVGIVTRADLVRAFARRDEEIAREIEEEVLLRTFGIAPENLSVVVEGGEVALGGEVETDYVRESLVAFVARVPGVIAVRSRLTVREDSRLPRPQRVRP